MPRDDKVKRDFAVSWWKLITGSALLAVGILFFSFYVRDIQNMFMAILSVFTLTPGGFLIYLGLKSGKMGFSFSAEGGTKYTGKENSIVLVAYRDKVTKKDVPRGIFFATIKPNKIPLGARKHYLRNLKKHFYELYIDGATGKLLPVVLPDKKSSPPELFKIPATMQPYKDCMEYNPPNLFQKLAPGVILAAMGIVGLLMLVTGG